MGGYLIFVHYQWRENNLYTIAAYSHHPYIRCSLGAAASGGSEGGGGVNPPLRSDNLITTEQSLLALLAAPWLDHYYFTLRMIQR